MSEIDIREQIKFLIELQKIDAEIYSCQKDLIEKPAYLQECQKRFEEKKEGLKKLQDQQKAVQLARKSDEVDLQAKEDAIAKANVQLSQIKTNKEYSAKITEIEHIKADQSIVEEKILTSYDVSDGIKVAIDREREVLATEEKKYLAEKKEIEALIKQVEDRIRVLTSQRQQIVPSVDKVILSRYERVLKNKDGLALVPVEENSCGGCFMNVPAQVINEIKMHKSLITCEMCARILYIKEDF